MLVLIYKNNLDHLLIYIAIRLFICDKDTAFL